MLWAGIILNIAKAVEKEIGTVCVRLFRMLQVSLYHRLGKIFMYLLHIKFRVETTLSMKIAVTPLHAADFTLNPGIANSTR